MALIGKHLVQARPFVCVMPCNALQRLTGKADIN